MPQAGFARLRWSVAFLLVWAMLPGVEPAFAAAPPRRIVSLNLCADGLLVALADREQVLSLSPLSRDPWTSFLARESAGYPTNIGKGEAILFTGADLVLTGRWGAQATQSLLARQGIATLAIDEWESLEGGRAQVRMIAARLGHPERGERLIAALDAALERTRSIVPPGRSALPLQHRGWVEGQDSLLTEILRHMGFTPHQGRLGLQGGGAARLEHLVTAPPDYAILDEAAQDVMDNGGAFLAHPALAAALPPKRRLILPLRLSICGGPSIPAAIDALAAEVRAKVR